ncbi:MAG: PspC domain-containing protein [Gammaproteobacteria bacterium]|nr:PspC domain-containing protein [Gammaproteobacteria bacterium]MDH4313455.1 PspC domain-containing protein [Gammaproteobacteria bacterium]MDH5213031.1 PspC domain-containing protein [Gammaproteobacteria bacterium]
MSRETWNIDRGRPRGLYRDPENGWVFGVCAGLADFCNFRVGTVRLIAFVCLIVFFWATVLLYIGATLLFREKPLVYSGSRAEYEFWRRRDTERDWGRT